MQAKPFTKQLSGIVFICLLQISFSVLADQEPTAPPLEEAFSEYLDKTRVYSRSKTGQTEQRIKKRAKNAFISYLDNHAYTDSCPSASMLGFQFFVHEYIKPFYAETLVAIEKQSDFEQADAMKLRAEKKIASWSVKYFYKKMIVLQGLDQTDNSIQQSKSLSQAEAASHLTAYLTHYNENAGNPTYRDFYAHKGHYKQAIMDQFRSGAFPETLRFNLTALQNGAEADSETSDLK
ncbi:hypothetical protein [Endozoicomonas arenosclerae]|uniref:hypothetical protein n=1 Tax=Endozoicomonas arenosclerae TaxID=1633495 RepID=UPI0007854250|nr:hypothetical protein [Endozoicomonas arenosclerae]